MSDGISVSGGGSLAVNTPEMQKAEALLSAAVADLSALAGRIADVRARPGAGLGGPALDLALTALRAAHAAGADTASGLRIAAVRYGAAEDAAATTFRDVSAVTAGETGIVIGDLERSFGVAPVRWLEAHAAGVLGALMPSGGADTVSPLDAAKQRAWDAGWSPAAFDPAANPVVTGAIGLLVASTDDFVRGERGEEHLAQALGTDPTAAWSTQRMARKGATQFHDLPGVAVRADGGRIEEVPARPGFAAPHDLAALGALVPDDGDGRAQVRVEAVTGADGRRRWIVAVAGTTTFDPNDRDQVFDMRSNLQGVGQEPMDAELATERAMRDAGVRPGEPVLVVGHSQGALVATGLAQSGRFDVAAVVTLGGPIRAVTVPAGVPVLAVEHTDDWVPTLGGAAPSGPPPANVVRVTRTVYDTQPPPIVGHVALDPAHLPSEYVRTLALADRSTDERVVAFRDRAAPFLTGTAASEQLYRADRVAVPGPAGPAPGPWRSQFGTPGVPLGTVASGGESVSGARSGGLTAAAGSARPPSR